ncbi:MAG: Ig-like domain-containing protein, partial [Bacillota bacterium]
MTVRLVPASGGAALAEQQFTVTVAQPQAPTVALTLPPSLTVGVAGKITAEATNPSDGLAYSSVRFRITVDAPGDFTSADQVTAVAAQGDPAAGQSVAFELDQNGNLVGWWGPAGGFQMPKGYDVTTTFDVTVKTGAPTGTYNVTVELVNLAAEPDQVLASQSGQVTVWPQDGVLDKFTLPSGGAVLNQSGAQLEIPQGAFSGAATITFKPVEDKSGLPGAGSIGQVFEVKIENVQLAQPVTLRLPLPQQAGERVRVFKLVGNRWVNLGGKVSGGYVEVSLTSFSTFTAANAPAPPTASPAPGTYTSSVKVTLSAESGATILYGLNTAPQTVYTGPITLTSSATVRAVAVKDFLTSDEATFAYTITAAGGGGGGGVVRPYVSTTDPADKATGVPVDKEIKVVFSESVSAGDSFAGIALKDASGKAVEVSTRIEGSALYIKPKAALAYGAAYTVVIPARAVKDSDGYGLSADYTFSFTTAAKEVQPPPPPPVVSFKDMASHWAAEAVGKLAGKGIVTGYPDGTFKPERQVGRAEIAAILVRALKLAPGSEQELKFKDSAAIPVWAR